MKSSQGALFQWLNLHNFLTPAHPLLSTLPSPPDHALVYHHISFLALFILCDHFLVHWFPCLIYVSILIPHPLHSHPLCVRLLHLGMCKTHLFIVEVKGFIFVWNAYGPHNAISFAGRLKALLFHPIFSYLSPFTSCLKPLCIEFAEYAIYAFHSLWGFLFPLPPPKW